MRERRAWRERLRRPSLAFGAAVAVILAALAASWAALQPVRSAYADERAQDAAELGNYELAAERARRGAERNPLSLEPLWLLAFIEDARGDAQGRQPLPRARRRRASPPAPRRGAGSVATA